MELVEKSEENHWKIHRFRENTGVFYQWIILENHWKIHHFSTSSCKDLGEKIANPLVKSITFLMMVRANDIFQPHVSCFLGVQRELFAHVMCLPSL